MIAFMILVSMSEEKIQIEKLRIDRIIVKWFQECGLNLRSQYGSQ
jgi:hypothetical protein